MLCVARSGDAGTSISVAQTDSMPGNAHAWPADAEEVLLCRDAPGADNGPRIYVSGTALPIHAAMLDPSPSSHISSCRPTLPTTLTASTAPRLAVLTTHSLPCPAPPPACALPPALLPARRPPRTLLESSSVSCFLAPLVARTYYRQTTPTHTSAPVPACTCDTLGGWTVVRASIRIKAHLSYELSLVVYCVLCGGVDYERGIVRELLQNGGRTVYSKGWHESLALANPEESTASLRHCRGAPPCPCKLHDRSYSVCKYPG